MLKIRKKYIAILMMLLLIFSLSACGQGSQSSSGGADDGTGENTSENTGETQSEEPEGDADTQGQEEKEQEDFTVNYDGIETEDYRVGLSLHDPCMLKVGDTYYMYGSHMTAAKSQDLKNWEKVADGYNVTNKVYGGFLTQEHIFDYTGHANSAIPTEDGTVHVWAPFVMYNESKGLYYMYFCTSSNWNSSNLCYATSESPEGPFIWQDKLICSGFNSKTIKATNVLDVVGKKYALEHYTKAGDVYNFDEYPNAIDPDLFYDKDGKLWMVYGSWSGGIFLLEIDEETMEVIHPEADEENGVDPYFGKRLIGGGHISIEGPCIIYDEKSGYYYLFVSYGGLDRAGGYQMRVFRSETVDGDYVDMNGQAPSLGGSAHMYMGVKLSGNYMLPGLNTAYMATGGNSVMRDEDGKAYVIHHTRFDNYTEYHEPRVRQFMVNEEGWPCLMPYPTSGETLSETGYDKSLETGMYYVVNQGLNIDDVIAEPFMLKLSESGEVKGEEVSGTWEVKDNSPYVTITYDDETYKGVFCEMEDESGNPVMVFSAVGNNKSIWGVKY